VSKPLAIDLFCGLGGWAEGFLAEGYRVVGFDIERHDYGTGGYPGGARLAGYPHAARCPATRCRGDCGESTVPVLFSDGHAV